jgi:hypothetical protein
MGKKSRLKRLRAERAITSGSTCDDPSWPTLQFLQTGHLPPQAEVETMQRAFQQNLRNSPLWEMMVEKFGEQRAEELLRQCAVRVDPVL